MLKESRPKIFDVDIYGLAAVIALAALGWLLLMRPLELKFSRQQQERLKIMQNNQSLCNELKGLQDRVQHQENLVNDLKKTIVVTEDNKGIPEVIRTISCLTQQCELRLDEVLPRPPQHTENYQKTRLLLRLYGSFPQLYEWLKLMTVQLKTVRIYSLDMNNRSSPKGLCEIAMELDVFTLQ